MKKWCSNKTAGVFFDDIPQVGIRYSVPSMTKEEMVAWAEEHGITGLSTSSTREELIAAIEAALEG